MIRRPHGEGGHKESEVVCRRMIGRPKLGLRLRGPGANSGGEEASGRALRLIEKQEPAAGKWAGEQTCAPSVSLGDSGAGRLPQHTGAACSCTGPQFDVKQAHGAHNGLQLCPQGN